ncbi:hypothetical protein AAH086_12375, partial [Bacteroides uniformis]
DNIRTRPSKSYAVSPKCYNDERHGYCQEFRGWADSYMDLYVMGYAIAYPLMVGYAWVSGGCTDVRYLGASLEKPSFWPDEMN